MPQEPRASVFPWKKCKHPQSQGEWSAEEWLIGHEKVCRCAEQIVPGPPDHVPKTYTYIYIQCDTLCDVQVATERRWGRKRRGKEKWTYGERVPDCETITKNRCYGSVKDSLYKNEPD